MKRIIKADTNIDPLFKHIEDQIWATLSKYMHGPKGGFPKGDDEWKEYTRVEIGDYADDPSLIEVQVRSEFLVDFSSAIEISNKLDRVVEKYDPDSYFDVLDAGILVAYLDKGILNR